MQSQNKKNKNKTFWTAERLKWTVIGQCGFTVVLLGTHLSLIKQWSMERQNVVIYKEKTICIPCNELHSSEFQNLIEFEQRNETDTDNVTCCTVLSKVLNRLIDKHAVSNFKALQSTRIIGRIGDECNGKAKNPQKPYAKMTGLSFTDMANETDNIIQWNTTVHGGNVKPLDGKIFIIDPGFYFVFSQLKLQSPDSNSVPSHSVYLHSYQRETLKPILENSKSACETTSANRETVSTLGAIFQLEKHDKLFVRSSHPEHLASGEHSNVFGLYMM